MIDPILGTFTAVGVAVGGPIGGIVGALLSIPFANARDNAKYHKTAAKLGYSKEQADAYSRGEYDENGKYRG